VGPPLLNTHILAINTHHGVQQVVYHHQFLRLQKNLSWHTQYLKYSLVYNQRVNPLGYSQNAKLTGFTKILQTNEFTVSINLIPSDVYGLYW
jgi:hypothetical protein